jgi:hypothetical protein
MRRPFREQRSKVISPNLRRYRVRRGYVSSAGSDALHLRQTDLALFSSRCAGSKMAVAVCPIAAAMEKSLRLVRGEQNGRIEERDVNGTETESA